MRKFYRDRGSDRCIIKNSRKIRQFNSFVLKGIENSICSCKERDETYFKQNLKILRISTILEE